MECLFEIIPGEIKTIFLDPKEAAEVLTEQGFMWATKGKVLFINDIKPGVLHEAWRYWLQTRRQPLDGCRSAHRSESRQQTD